MADAFTTVMSNLDTLRQKSVQYESDAKQINANTLGTIMEDGAKLANTLYTQKVEEDMTKLQNYLNEEEAKGTFNWVDGIEENGVEYNPDGIYNNYVNAANKWISENSKGLSTLGLKKSANSYLEGLKASIYSNTRSSNYDAVQQNTKSSIAQLTSTSFDPLNENSINLKISAAYPDYSSVDDLSNVTTYGINEDAAEYKELMSRYKDGSASEYDIYQLEELSFRIQFKLSSIIAGESDYYYENYTSKDYDDALMQLRVAQGVKAAAAGVVDEYIKAGGDSNVITLAVNNFEADITNNGLVVGKDENGNDIIITGAEMGDTVFNTAVNEYSNTLTVQSANALKAQTTAWEDATKAVEEEYKSLGGYLPFTSVGDYVSALQTKDGNLDEQYATALVNNDAKLKNTFAYNAEQEKYRKAIEMYTDGTDTETLITYLEDNNLIPYATTTLGWNTLEDRSDDEKDNKIMMAHDILKNDEKLSNNEIRTLLFGEYGDTSTITERVQNIFDTYKYHENEKSKKISAEIDNLSDIAIKAFTDGAGMTLEDSYTANGLTDSETYSQFTKVAEDVMKDESVAAYIEANPEDGREILKYTWISKSSSSSEEEKADAEAKLAEYDSKITDFELIEETKAGNEEWIDIGINYLTGTEEERNEIEKQATADGKLKYLTAITEGDLGKEIKRSAYNEDGTINREKVTEIINNWNGNTTSLSSTYEDTTGASKYTSEKTFYQEKNRDSYIQAVVSGASGGIEGIKQSLEKAGFSYNDPMYQDFQDIWEDVADDEVLMRAISSDTTGETADEIYTALYGMKTGEITTDEADSVITNIKFAQELYDGNKEVMRNIDILLDPSAHTKEELEEVEQWAIDNGYIDIFANVLGFGNNLADPSDDDLSNPYRATYEVKKQDAAEKGIDFNSIEEFLRILSEEQYDIKAAQDLTSVQKQEHASAYYTGKNTEAFSNDAVNLLADGLSIEEAKTKLEATYSPLYNKKLYSTFFGYLENNPELVEAISGADEETRKDVVAAITTIQNTTTTTGDGGYYIAAVQTLTDVKNAYNDKKISESNRQANTEMANALAPMLDEGASEEAVATATQYMKDNNLFNLMQNEIFKGFVKDYAEKNDVSTADAIAYALEDLDPETLKSGSFAGFTEDLTSENHVYSWGRAKDWDDIQEAKKKEQAIEDNRVATGELLVKTLNKGETYSEEIAESLADYPAYQSIYTALTKANNTTFDEVIRTDLLMVCASDETLANNIMIYTGVYLNGSSDTEKKAAYNKLLSIAATAFFDNRQGTYVLGYVASNQKFDGENISASSKSNGVYDESLTDYLVSTSIRRQIITKEKMTGAEIKANLSKLLGECLSGGVDVTEEIKKLAQLSDDQIEAMSWEELMAEFPDLSSDVKENAVNAYTSFNAKYGDAEYNGGAYYGSNFDAIFEKKGDSESIALNDAVYMSACHTGLCKFGETYQGRTPSDDLLKQGSIGSDNFYATALSLYLAENENDRKTILKEAEKFLTADSIKELEEMEPVNLLVRGYGIEGLENYDVVANIKTKLKGNYSYNVVNSDPTDIVKYIASRSSYLSDLKTALATGDKATIRKALNDFENKIISGYVAQIDSTEGSLASFTTSTLNPIVKDSSSLSAEEQSTQAENYYVNRTDSRDTINKSAYSDDYRIQENMANLISGENLSEATVACSIKLVDQNIDATTALVASDAMALSMMGIDVGLTEDSFSSEGIAVTKKRIYSILGNHSNDTRWLSYFYGLSKELDTYYITQREYDALGYDDTYTIDTSGTVTFTDGSTADKDNGAWIRSYGDGTNENITLTSNTTDLSYKVKYLFEGRYEKTNAAGTVSTVTLRFSEQSQTADTIRNYNTQKAKQFGEDIDYASATEMYVDPEYFTDEMTLSSIGIGSWQVKEVTGETLLAEYVNSLVEGTDVSEQKAEAILSQVSDGMADYIRTASDELFSELARALVDVSSPSKVWDWGNMNASTFMSMVSGNKVSALLALIKGGMTTMSGIPDNLRRLANEAIGRTIANKLPTDKKASNTTTSQKEKKEEEESVTGKTRTRRSVIK